MKTLLMALAAVVALSASANAHAAPTKAVAPTYTVRPDTFDGSSGDFGHSKITASFSDQYDFTNVGAGTYDLTLSTASKGISFSTMTFDNDPLKFLFSAGGSKYYGISDVSVAAGTQLLDVVGKFAGASGTTGSYDGTVAFTSAAPEPSTWLLMFAGIGGMGLMLRQAKRKIGFGTKGASAA